MSDVKRFNTYLATLLLAGLLGGCSSPEERREKEEASSIRFHLEKEVDRNDSTMIVPVYRADPVLIQIEKTPFLDEGNLTYAQVVTVMGGFAISLQFDFHGTLLLEDVSNSYRGRRMVIYSMFNDARWLAAPRLVRPIRNGLVVFTPDATREEAERLVRGLNNVASELGNKVEPKVGQTEEPF